MKRNTARLGVAPLLLGCLQCWPRGDSPAHPCRIGARADTCAHVKITVEIADALLDEAKRLASRDRTTVRALTEGGLRRVVAERKRGEDFRLREASFGGLGLGPELEGAGCDRLRDLAYRGHGELGVCGATKRPSSPSTTALRAGRSMTIACHTRSRRMSV